jgi:hypothetical protein
MDQSYAASEREDWLEDLAFKRQEMPKGLTYPEQLLFLRFRYLYAYAAMIQMDPEQGKREKQEILVSYLGDLANHQLYLGCNDMWNRAGAAAAEIRKDSELYNNDKVRNLMIAIYGKADRRTPDETERRSEHP